MRELTLNDVPDLLDEDYVATRSFNDLLAEGIPHEGGARDARKGGEGMHAVRRTEPEMMRKRMHRG
jgi:hypothetical protein